jgi:hypothetical protein
MPNQFLTNRRKTYNEDLFNKWYGENIHMQKSEAGPLSLSIDKIKAKMSERI